MPSNGRVGFHVALLPAALGLAGGAALAALGARQLAHTGAWTLWATAAILVVAAASLLAGRLWALLFAASFLALGALGLAALGLVLLREGLGQHTGGDGWGDLRALLVGGTGLAALAFASLCVALGATLVIPWRAVASGRSLPVWLASSAGVLAMLLVVAWLLGAQLWRRQLFAQNECLAGSVSRCDQLGEDAARFPVALRRAFAQRGCEAGGDASCRRLLTLLEGPGDRGEGLRALEGRCEAGNLDLCRRLGEHLLDTGDAEAGARRLDETCARDVRWCDEAARALGERGRDDLARRMWERGCAADQAPSCRGLLHQASPPLDREERARLELYTCLIGDVNDCLPLVRRDLRGTCAPVCAGDTEARWQTCRRCAREAAEAGNRELAAEWLSRICSRGDAWACRELESLPLSPTPGVT